MEEHKEQPDGRHASGLDEVVALAEKAAGTIERLRAENLALSGKLRTLEASSAAEAEALGQRIRELEDACAALADDATRYQWLRKKFAGSAFLTHIERSYRIDQEMEAEEEAKAEAEAEAEAEGEAGNIRVADHEEHR